jgi:hypothetical protein
MASFTFDYEFIINNNEIHNTTDFDNIYNLCTLPDPSNNRKAIIKNKSIELCNMLVKLKNLRTFSSFILIDDYNYKITINNTSFVNFM